MKIGIFVEKDDGTTEHIDMDEVQKFVPEGQTLSWDPVKAARCAAACSNRRGYGACLARCIATSEVCDGGHENCTPL
jgi:hypothetical protein